MEYRKTTTPSYVNFYLIAANVIYFLFVEWKGSTEDVECMLQWGCHVYTMTPECYKRKLYKKSAK